MTRLSLILGLLLSFAAPAAAQVHAGVALDAALTDGIAALDVRAPDSDLGAARLRLTADGRTPGAVVDVWVRGTTDEAAALFSAQARTSASHVLVARSGLGNEAVADLAAGRAGIVVMRRDNVVVAVRTIGDQLDAAEIAAGFDRAVAASPTGSPRASGSLSRQAVGEAVDLSVAGALDLIAVPDGAGVARRTERGFSATGNGTVFWVDAQLRVGCAPF